MTGTSRTPSLMVLPEVRFGFAEAAVLVAATVCHDLGVSVQVGLVLLALVVVVSAAYLPPRFTVVVALSAWAFLTGFVVNAGGQLSFHPADLDRMGVLVLVALLAATLPAFIRRARAVVATGRARPVEAPRA